MNNRSRRPCSILCDIPRYIEDNDIIIDTPFQLWNKLTLVTIASMLMTIGLFIWAALIHDGVAMTAIGTISMSTSIACLANKWRPTLSSRAVINSVPKGDIVIKTRSGAFVVVHCNEDVTRELYTCTDVCRYKFEDSELQWMLGLSTVLPIASIIFFTNCGWAMQTAIGMTYIILNMMYWFIPFAMEDGKTWDLSLYRTTYDKKRDRKEYSSYTLALWHAIWETKSVDWVKRSGAAPDTMSLGGMAEACPGERGWSKLSLGSGGKEGPTDGRGESAANDCRSHSQFFVCLGACSCIKWLARRVFLYCNKENAIIIP